MALPKLNTSSFYELTIPSTKKVVKYRPYLVKEEKVLLLAYESKDPKQVMNALLNTIENCVEKTPDLNFKKLSTFDVEYMFLKIRSKSVGETSKIYIKCGPCKHPNEVKVNLEEIEVSNNSDSNMIQLTSDISLEMKYPSFESLSSNDFSKIETEQGVDTETAFKILTDSIEAVLTNDERILMKDETESDVRNFIESLTSSQFQKIVNFIQDAPRLSHKVSFNCEKCEENNELVLEGLSDFF